MAIYMTVRIFLLKKISLNFFFQYPKSTKIKFITASVQENNAKYSTKHISNLTFYLFAFFTLFHLLRICDK